MNLQDQGPFDDALGLMGMDFSRTRLVILRGESGSGKSSAIRFLMNRHPHFLADSRLRVIEELRFAADLRHVLSALRSGHRLLIASHLDPIWHRLLALAGKTRIIELDRHPHKIERWLKARSIPFSSEAVSAFCRRFGANYTDVQLVLAHAQTDSFDLALRRFFKQCQLRREPPGAAHPVLVLDVPAAEDHYQSLNDRGLKQIP